MFVIFFSCLTTGTPMVRFGTKWPSMTSTCTYPAPPASMTLMSRCRFMKSADRMDGAILTGSNTPGSFPLGFSSSCAYSSAPRLARRRGARQPYNIDKLPKEA